MSNRASTVHEVRVLRCGRRLDFGKAALGKLVAKGGVLLEGNDNNDQELTAEDGVAPASGSFGAIELLLGEDENVLNLSVVT